MFDAWIATPFKGWLSLCMPYTRQVVELIIRLQVLNVISMRLNPGEPDFRHLKGLQTLL